MIVDAHVHIFDQLRGGTGRGPSEPLSFGKVRLGDGEVIRLLPPLAERTAFQAEALLEYMDATGVDRAVLLQAPFYGDLNAYVGGAVRTWPARFAGALIVNPRESDARTVFEQAVADNEFVAIKLEMSESTGLCGMYPDLKIDDPAHDWIWERASALNLTVTLDLGAIGGRAYQTEAVGRLARRYPRLRWVIAHLGQPTDDCGKGTSAGNAWREQIFLATLPNVWFDLSSLMLRFPHERYPYRTAQAYLRQAIELVGAGKILWGSDAPGMLSMLTYRQMLDFVAADCDWLSQENRALILGDNARIAYQLDRSSTIGTERTGERSASGR